MTFADLVVKHGAFAVITAITICCVIPTYFVVLAARIAWFGWDDVDDE